MKKRFPHRNIKDSPFYDNDDDDDYNHTDLNESYSSSYNHGKKNKKDRPFIFKYIVYFVVFLIFLVLTIYIVIKLNNVTITTNHSKYNNHTWTLTYCSSCNDLMMKTINIQNLNGDGKVLNKAGIVIRKQDICIELKNSDFQYGTYIIDKPNQCFQLTENIIFHPNPEHDFRPRKLSQQKYNKSQFRLDFFAAIAIQTTGITINLNGFEIRQSIAHNLQQRFFACIELNDRPFIPGQGPADFGPPPLGQSEKIIIRNGFIGLSSHHGLHANQIDNLLIEDVTFRKYEVAAISINGGKNIVLRRIKAEGTSKKISVKGTYSNARFIIPFINQTLLFANINGYQNHIDKLRLENDYNHLRVLMDQVYKDIVLDDKGMIDKNINNEAYQLFGNPSGLIDGNTYGLLFNNHGVAVNGFSCDPTSEKQSNMYNIYVEDSIISNTIGKVDEVLALATVTDQNTGAFKINRGPAGDVLRIEEILNQNNGSYNGHALSNVQISLAKLWKTMDYSLKSTLFIDDAIIEWVFNKNTEDFITKLQNKDFLIKRNGDTMFHVNKGVFGIRFDGGMHIRMSNVLVENVTNLGSSGKLYTLYGEPHSPIATTAASAAYIGLNDGGHPQQGVQLGYMGADSRGVSIATTSDISLINVKVKNVVSKNGWSHGLDLFNFASDIGLYNIEINNVTTLNNMKMFYKVPRAIGFRTVTNSNNFRYRENIKISSIQTLKTQNMNSEIVTESSLINEHSDCKRFIPENNLNYK